MVLSHSRMATVISRSAKERTSFARATVVSILPYQIRFVT